MMKNKLRLRVITLMLPLLFFSLWTFGQAVTVQGTVKDDAGIPMVGVNVVIKGTTVGTITDVNGKYSISVTSADDVLLFSFIGYQNQSIPVAGKSVIDVTLATDLVSLDDVVVVGYGTVKKSDVTGSVTSVKNKDLMATAPASIQQALQGKAAGVVITANTGINSDPSIRIRGTRSMTAGYNDPLFVIDGIPSSGGLETLNPIDIESIEILKDASATAIYGSRGANGVFMVTTKKGNSDKVTVEYQGYTSVGYMNKIYKAQNGADFVEWVREANRSYTYDGNGGYAINPAGTYGYADANFDADMATTYFSASWDPYVNQSLRMAWNNGVYDPSKLRTFDWQGAGYRDHSVSQSHSISIRGGSKNTKVYVSGSYIKLEDLALQSKRDRYTLRMNLDQTLGDHITIGGNVDFGYLNWDDGKGIATFWSPLGTPWKSPNGDVTLAGDPSLGYLEHPCGEPLQINSFFDLDGVKRGNKRNNLRTTFYGELKIIDGLTYRANFGAIFNVKQVQEFDSHYSTVTGLGDPKAKQENWIDRGYTFDNIITYNKKLNEHSVGVTLVQSNEQSVDEYTKLDAQKLPIESQLWNKMDAASTQAVTSDFTKWTLKSWLGRINYSFKDRYLLTASIRRDGSSRLAEGHKWVNFPSVALAWRISEEGFIKNITVIDNLKLRAGWGKTGNASVDAYSTVGQIASSRYNWEKTTGAMGYAPSTLSTPSLTWETTASTNLGIDFGFLNSRVSGTIDVYKQKTTDLLSNLSLPTCSGFSSIKANIGETENKGIEISLTTINIKQDKLEWSTTLTFAANKEKITKLASGLENDKANFWFTGQPIDTYYDYVAADKVWGYSQADMAEMALFNANGTAYKPGDLRLVDLNGDYKITDADRTIRGHRVPKWTVSMANSVRYGSFDLYVFMHAAVGHTVYWNPGIGISGRLNTYKHDYWTPEHTDTKYLAPHSGIEMPSNATAMYYWKGDFLKITDITLGYTLPNELSQKAKIQSVRLYVKVQNPFLFTKFEGRDSEGSIANTARRYDNNYNTYSDPTYTMRNYMLGLNVTF
jgi:TonB-linked SusC/RagA family outer membrane protein